MHETLYAMERLSECCVNYQSPSRGERGKGTCRQSPQGHLPLHKWLHPCSSKDLPNRTGSEAWWNPTVETHCQWWQWATTVCCWFLGILSMVIGIWNVRSINQGKSEVVKQEMARVNVNILGISELKWIGMGEFNSDDHYICCCGQKSLRRNE